jgi:hypothetical protein
MSGLSISLLDKTPTATSFAALHQPNLPAACAMPAAHKHSEQGSEYTNVDDYPACSERTTPTKKSADGIQESQLKENRSPGARQLLHSDSWLNVLPDIDFIPHRELRRSKRHLEAQKHRQISLLKGELKPAHWGAD